MRVVRLVLGLGLLASVGIGAASMATGLAVVETYSRDLPDHRGLATYVPKTGSEILAADGSLLSKRTDQRRTFVTVGNIPQLVKQAFISAEDRSYFSHQGVDLIAVARAAVGHASGASASGGSTITQQVAKNLLVGNERSVVRKVREALLAMRMDKDLGKDRVLEIYLNEIYLGLGAYGVAEAAQTYFGKSLDSLTVGEAALLAGMPKAPSSFNPVRNPARALERRNYVLRRMAEDGAIDVVAASAAIGQPIRLAERKHKENASDSQEGWFQDLAWKQALSSLPNDLQSRQDIVVRTTLRPDLQTAADTALKAGIRRTDQILGWRGPLARVRLPVNWSAPELDPPAGSSDFSLGVVESVGAEAVVALGPTERVRLGADGVRWTGRRLQEVVRAGDVILLDLLGGRPQLAQMPEVEGALVALDPRSGDVLALVGGFSRERSQFDRATQARRQAGSSFKPILYSGALEIGFDATSPILDAPIVIEQGPGMVDWRPADPQGRSRGGLVTVRRALEQSRNIPSARLSWTLGLQDVQDVARRLGISGSMTNAAALGAIEVTPLQMAMAYGAFANGGSLVQPRYVNEIRSREGQLILREPVQSAPAIDPLAASQMASILKGVVERGTARTAFSGFGRNFAGKTGTTNSARDVWFVGFAEDVVVAVWIGRDDNKVLFQGAGGGRVAAPIVRDFLDHSGTSFTLKEPPVAQGLVPLVVDPSTGLPARSGQVELVRADSPLLSAISIESGRPGTPRRARTPPALPVDPITPQEFVPEED